MYTIRFYEDVTWRDGSFALLGCSHLLSVQYDMNAPQHQLLYMQRNRVSLCKVILNSLIIAALRNVLRRDIQSKTRVNNCRELRAWRRFANSLIMRIMRAEGLWAESRDPTAERWCRLLTQTVSAHMTAADTQERFTLLQLAFQTSLYPLCLAVYCMHTHFSTDVSANENHFATAFLFGATWVELG